MEGDGVTTTSAAAVAVAIPTPPPHDPDFSPVGSPEIADHHFEDIEEEEEEIAPHASADQKPHPTPTLTDDLRDKIIKQVEYYFSDENLPNDKFLMNYVTKDVEGFVPIAVIASFRKMKRLTHDSSLIVAALKQSSFLVVSSNSKVRRLLPFPVAEVMDPKRIIQQKIFREYLVKLESMLFPRFPFHIVVSLISLSSINIFNSCRMILKFQHKKYLHP
ncbi:hypothetical protein CsSME_00030146 [Camellia sinensis var. sinensis]